VVDTDNIYINIHTGTHTGRQTHDTHTTHSDGRPIVYSSGLSWTWEQRQMLNNSFLHNTTTGWSLVRSLARSLTARANYKESTEVSRRWPCVNYHWSRPLIRHAPKLQPEFTREARRKPPGGNAEANKPVVSHNHNLYRPVLHRRLPLAQKLTLIGDVHKSDSQDGCNQHHWCRCMTR